MPPTRVIAGLLLALTFLFPTTPARADDDLQPLQLYEEKIKAGLVYNFLKYTEWPADREVLDTPLQLCLIGKAAVDQYLYPLEGRSAQQHGIKIRRSVSGAQSQNCDLVFIHRDQAALIPALIQNLKGRAVLTVSDVAGFTDAGGMVEFGMRDNHVGFIVNSKAAADVGIKVQDRMLRLSWRDSASANE